LSAALLDSALITEVWGIDAQRADYLLNAHGIERVGELRSLYKGIANGEAVFIDLARCSVDVSSTVRELGSDPLTRAAAYVRARLRLDGALALSVVAAMSTVAGTDELAAALAASPTYPHQLDEPPREGH